MIAPTSVSSVSNTMIALSALCRRLQDIIGTDAGGRGMKSLIVQDDLFHAAKIFGSLGFDTTTTTTSTLSESAEEAVVQVSSFTPKHVVVISGFPCCVTQSPPTETDGPPGTFALARCAAAMGHKVTVVVDDCNAAVFQAALTDLAMPKSLSATTTTTTNTVGTVSLQSFPSDNEWNDDAEQQFCQLQSSCDLLLACERAGPGTDGICYTMRGINMNEKNLIAPLHRLASSAYAATADKDETTRSYPFCAIGDGGNELGMGKVINNIINNPQISNGSKIGCVVPADHLIAASVSNWGGYALSVGGAAIHALYRHWLSSTASSSTSTTPQPSDTASQLLQVPFELIAEWITRCVPTEQEEIELLQRCVNAGCRDGVSGKMECTVDGMPLETSLQCLRDLRNAVSLSLQS